MSGLTIAWRLRWLIAVAIPIITWQFHRPLAFVMFMVLWPVAIFALILRAAPSARRREQQRRRAHVVAESRRMIDGS
jgi:hypothetical protein